MTPRPRRRAHRDDPAGQAHPRAVLTDEQAVALLADRMAGASLGELARAYGISKTQAGRIVRGERQIQAHDLPDDALVPRRHCPDPLPSLPRLRRGQAAGARAFELIAYQISRVLSLSTC